jgi:hypothetical protein
MNKKNFLVSIIFLLILIPFAISIDFNGDGIDDGEQNLCGDLFCQIWETEINCPTDCTLSSTPSSGDLTEIPLESEDNLPSEEIIVEEYIPSENTFFSSTAFKIAILSGGLISIGLIIYFIIRKKKYQNKIPETTNQIEQE